MPVALPAFRAHNASTVSSISLRLRAVMHTFTPSRTRASAMARPIPFVPPVTIATFPLSSICLTPLAGQLGLQAFIHDFRIGLPLRCFHDLAHEKAEQCFFSSAIAFHLLLIGAQDLIDDRIDLIRIADLNHSL